MSADPIIVNVWLRDKIGREWKHFKNDEIDGEETCAFCLAKISAGYATSISYPHVVNKQYMHVCTEHIKVRLYTYYVAKEDDLFVLRQSRYMGVDHPHDTCAFTRTVEQMHEMCDNLFRGAIDYSEVEETNEEAM